MTDASRETPRVLAFYLPQYHPVPENDEWWGPGFTEWANVARARPLFSGHDQPHLPRDLGFYDLRLAETRAAQAALAQAHGIDGFVYYHYWFGGRRILERPFEEVRRLGEPALPFCLCWANENWTRIWDGGSKQVLLEQQYSEEDDRQHMRSLVAAFADPRYIRVDGKPLFLVYRASAIPDAARTTDTWRDEAARLGIGELYLARVEAWREDRGDPTLRGFDAGVEFAPDVARLGGRLPSSKAQRLLNQARGRQGMRANSVYSYPRTVELAMQQSPTAYKRFRGVTPGWDNSARRRQGGARILHGSTPALYQAWLVDALEASVRYGPDEHLVFVNAWNEWAEGNHLEPGQRWGLQYLEATQAAVSAVERAQRSAAPT